MSVGGGATPACAVCKHQRRKCSRTCPLAPYFPANQPQMFQNVHRLFGVSNVTRTLEKLKTKDEKDDAMRSIIYEAEMRGRFPVDGCCAVIEELFLQLQLANEELRHVRANLNACRDQMIIAAGSSSSDNDAAAGTPHNRVGQFLLNENDEGLKTAHSMSSNMSWIEVQMNALGIHKRNNRINFESHNSIDFEAHHFNNYVVAESPTDEEMSSGRPANLNSMQSTI